MGPDNREPWVSGQEAFYRLWILPNISPKSSFNFSGKLGRKEAPLHFVLFCAKNPDRLRVLVGTTIGRRREL